MYIQSVYGGTFLGHFDFYHMYDFFFNVHSKQLRSFLDGQSSLTHIYWAGFTVWPTLFHWNIFTPFKGTHVCIFSSPEPKAHW